MLRQSFAILVGFAFAAGCTIIPDRDLPKPRRPVSGPPVIQSSARSEWQESFDTREMRGVVALLEEGRFLCSDEDACDDSRVPASTFKIAHTLIGLELGLLSGAEHAFPWDGESHAMPAWNQDHTLRSAMEVSCVPCFQSLAREIGEDRMGRYLSDFDYGNASVAPPIDAFWLAGGSLRISPYGQLRFLQRLAEGQLPISTKTRGVGIDVIPSARFGDVMVRGKTGMAKTLEETAGWYVGWIERGKDHLYFATLITGAPREEDIIPARREITLEVLRRHTGLALAESAHSEPERPDVAPPDVAPPEAVE